MRRLLIIDGHNLLFQMFFGMPARIINKDGKAIQGTLGFTGALLRIIKISNPSHVVVLFDSESENHRSQINADYKANRKDFSSIADEANPFSQLIDVYKALDYLKIKHTEVVESETDDCIASYALQYGKDLDIVISSFDSDFFQLITDKVSVLRYRGDHTTICTTGYLQDKYGILPEQYADFKAIVGDVSDNIRGAYKVGPKIASRLINQFGSLPEIVKRADEILQPSIKASIQNETERLLQNYELIKLDGKTGLPFQLKDLLYSYNGITTNEVLQGIHLK